MDAEGSGTANGTLIQLYTCNDSGAQQWHITTSGQIINPESGLCLEDPGFSTASATQRSHLSHQCGTTVAPASALMPQDPGAGTRGDVSCP
jgi:hypothetical protein